MILESAKPKSNTFFRVRNTMPEFDPVEYEELKRRIAADLWAALKRKEAVGN